MLTILFRRFGSSNVARAGMIALSNAPQYFQMHVRTASAFVINVTARISRHGGEMIVEELVVAELGAEWNADQSRGRHGISAMRTLARELAEIANANGLGRVRINAIRAGGSRPTARGSQAGYDGLFAVVQGPDGASLRRLSD